MATETRRTPISCGCTLLFGLGMVDERWLRNNLKSPYVRWSRRQRPDALGIEMAALRDAFGQYDNKIYAGETVLFSDADDNKNGERIYKLVKHHKLGDIRKVRGVNPNTGNRITTYVWRYNGKQLGGRA